MYVPCKYCAVNRRRCAVQCAKFQTAVRSGETAVATIGSFLSLSLVGILVSHCKDGELYRTVRNHLNVLASIYTFFRTKSSRERERTGRQGHVETVNLFTGLVGIVWNIYGFCGFSCSVFGNQKFCELLMLPVERYVTHCRWLDRFQHFEETRCLRREGRKESSRACEYLFVIDGFTL